MDDTSIEASDFMLEWVLQLNPTKPQNSIDTKYEVLGPFFNFIQILLLIFRLLSIRPFREIIATGRFSG